MRGTLSKLPYLSACLSLAILCGCASRPEVTSWLEIKARGPVFTVAEVNRRSDELNGRVVTIDGYLSQRGAYPVLIGGEGLGIPELTGAKGVPCTLSEPEQFPLYLNAETALPDVRKHLGKRIVLSARVSAETASKPIVPDQTSGLMISEVLRGPLTEVRVLKIFDEWCIYE